MAITKVTGALVDIGDLDLTNVGTLHLDSIVSDASPAAITVGYGINDTTTILGTTKIGTGFGQSPEVGGKLNIGFANSTSHTTGTATTGSNSALIVGNYPGVEAANLQSGIQFNIHGGSQNRVAQISAVSEASDSNLTSLVFHTDEGSNRTQKMRIAGDGTTTIGRAITTTYDNDQGYPLHVQAAGGSQTYIAISSPGANSGDTGLVIGHDGTGSRIINREDEPIVFHRASGVTMTLEADGDVAIADGNLSFASGHGIDFSATADGDNSGSGMSSELLDDYEEGQHTTTVTGNTSGSWSLSSAGDEYTYCKIGRSVHCHGFITVTGESSSVGAIGFTLPFTSISGGSSGDVQDDGEYSFGTMSLVNGAQNKAANNYVFVQSGDKAYLYYVSDTGSGAYYDSGDVDTAWAFGFSFTYTAA